MTEFRSSVDVVQSTSAYLRYSFVDADTGEVLCETKKPLQVLFNVSSKCSKQFDKVVNSYLRGFMSGRNLAIVLELKHPALVDEQDLEFY